VKTEGEAAGANWRRSQPRGRGSVRRKPDEAASRAKGRHRCESEVGCRPSRRKGSVRRKPDGVRIVGRKPDEPGSSGASLMDCRRSSGSAEQSTQVGGLQPVEPKDTKPIRAGGLATGGAGVQAADASRRSSAGTTRGNGASESWRPPLGEPEDATPAVLPSDQD